MKFSCKISNSIFHYLERSGVELSVIYDRLPMPIELLRDPSYWISAHDMELILSVVDNEAQFQRERERKENLFQQVAHLSAELKSWGVLDHVLRMMPKPFEIFHHPDTLLSHFIQPRPPVLNMQISDQKIEFDLPILQEDFPHVVEYLKSAIEAIPTYKGHPMAQCQWNGIHIEIQLEQNQIGLENFETENHLSPDLFRSVIREIEKRQPELAQMGFIETPAKEATVTLPPVRKFGQQDLFLDLQSEVGGGLESVQNSALSAVVEPREGTDQFVENQKGSGIEQLSKHDLRKLGQNLAKLNDYMYRAQQMVTVLSQTPMNKNTSQKLFQKTDWNSVRNQFPEILQESFKLLKHMDREGD